MKCLTIIIFVVFIFTSRIVFAGEGCVIGSNVYFSRAPTLLGLEVLGTNKVFSNVGNATNNCNDGANQGSCSVCDQGGTVVSINVLGLPVILCDKGGLLGTYTPAPGVYYSDYIMNCNLDDHSWLFGAAAGLFGIFIIRRKNKL